MDLATTRGMLVNWGAWIRSEQYPGAPNRNYYSQQPFVPGSPPEPLLDDKAKADALAVNVAYGLLTEHRRHESYRHALNTAYVANIKGSKFEMDEKFLALQFHLVSGLAEGSYRTTLTRAEKEIRNMIVVFDEFRDGYCPSVRKVV